MLITYIVKIDSSLHGRWPSQVGVHIPEVAYCVEYSHFFVLRLVQFIQRCFGVASFRGVGNIVFAHDPHLVCVGQLSGVLGGLGCLFHV